MARSNPLSSNASERTLSAIDEWLCRPVDPAEVIAAELWVSSADPQRCSWLAARSTMFRYSDSNITAMMAMWRYYDRTVQSRPFVVPDLEDLNSVHDALRRDISDWCAAQDDDA